MFVLFAITQIDRKDKRLQKLYRIHADDLARWADLDLNALRRDLWNITEAKDASIGAELLDEVLVLPNHFCPETGRHTVLGTHWFQTIMPERISGPCDFVDVRFSADLASYLIDLQIQKWFYTAKRAHLCKLTSRFAIRFYEWLESQPYTFSQEKRQIKVGLDKLRIILGTDRPVSYQDQEGLDEEVTLFVRDGIQYQRLLKTFAHFCNRALNVAIREVNSMTDFWVDEDFGVQRGGTRGQGVHTILLSISRSTVPKTSKKISGAANESGQITAAGWLDAHAGRSGSDPGQACDQVGVLPPSPDDIWYVEHQIKELAHYYQLSKPQSNGLLMHALATAGCKTLKECYEWLHSLDIEVRNENPANPAKHFMALAMGKFRRGHNIRVGSIKNPFEQLKPLDE